MLNVKEAPWKVILIQLLVTVAMISLVNLVLFPGPFLHPIARLTGGLIDGTLQANLLNILLFGLIVFGWGKLRPADVGLEWGKLAQGLSLTALLWLATQTVALFISWISGAVRIDPMWSEHGVTPVLGALLAQLAGNAFFEEMSYRGFYLSQFYLKIKNASERQRITQAILSMLGLFILSHIPNRIFKGYTLADMPLDFALLFAWGLFFTAIYLYSGNLFLAIGVHALVNRPTLITEASFPPQAILFLLTCLLLFALRRRTRSFQQRTIAT